MGGQVRNSLLPDRVNAGGPGKPKNYPNGLKPGRSTMFQGVKSSTQSKVLSDTDKNCIKTGFALFAKGSVGTIADAYVKMLRRFYTVKPMLGDVGDDLGDQRGGLDERHIRRVSGILRRHSP